MNTENIMQENTEINSQADFQEVRIIKTSSKVMRAITLGLQVVAMLAYYVPSIISGGSVGLIWLAIGVVQTAMFSAVFFRDERTRTGISIALMVIGTIWNLVMLLLTAFYALIGAQMGLSLDIAVIYAICSMIAMIFALCFPRRYNSSNSAAHPELESVTSSQ